MATLRDRITFNAAGTQRAAGIGRFFLIIAAAAPVTILCRQKNKGAGIVIDGVGVCRIGPVDEASAWEEVTITSGVAQVVEFINGDDPVEFPNAVSVAGDVVIVPRPSSTFTTPTKGTVNAASSVDIAQNLARKKITVAVESGSSNSIWLRDQAGVTDAGIEIQPGMNHTEDTTAALRIRNNGAAAVNYTITER